MAMLARRRSGGHLFAEIKELIARAISRVHHTKPESSTVLPELSSVISVSEIHESDKTVPCGAKGAIVFGHEDGAGYEVEFVEPEHIVISARRDELAPA